MLAGPWGWGIMCGDWLFSAAVELSFSLHGLPWLCEGKMVPREHNQLAPQVTLP